MASKRNTRANTNKATKKTLVTDTVLRDAHQSLLATRMRTSDMLEIAGLLDSVGYRHYADDVVKKFVERAAKNGVDVFRIFDALNDTRNLQVAMAAAKKAKAVVEAAICYTTSPVHTVDGFVKTAVELEKMGADVICIKDMAGLLTPGSAYSLVSKLREKTKLPIHIHSHDSSGLASMSYLKAIEAGANIIDTSISSLASGTSQPPTESIVAALKDTPYDTGLDLSLLTEIADRVRDIRKKYKRFESEYTGINTRTLVAQIPGGMISNLAHQLKEQNALDKMDDVLKEVPVVREELGYPPLVAPTSQVVGTQATLNVLTGERYKVITSETRNYFKGLYGKPPGKISEEARKKAIGNKSLSH